MPGHRGSPGSGFGGRLAWEASGPAASAPVSGGASRPRGDGVGREVLKGEGPTEGREGGRSQCVRDLIEGGSESKAQREGAGVEAEERPGALRGSD